MKKVLLFAVAALMGLGLSSCVKEKGTAPEGGERQEMVFKLTLGNKFSTQTIGAAGTASDANLNNGVVFVYDGDECVGKEALDVTTATSGGQLLSVLAPQVGTVYVVGNVPGADEAARLAVFSSIDVAATGVTGSTVADLLAITSDITTQQSDYLDVALMGSDPYDAATDVITAVGATQGQIAVSVAVAPVVSRLELLGVRADAAASTTGMYLARFDVVGVYVDGWHSEFTYGGSYAGSPFVGNNLTVNFVGGADELSDEAAAGTWQFDAGNAMNAQVSDPSVTPGVGEVWGYQVASGFTSVPRIVIGLTNIKITDGSTTTARGMTVGGVAKTAAELAAETFYVSITGYTQGMPVTPVASFLPANIYKVSDVSINPDHLGLTPNPENVALNVTVSVTPWTTVTVAPVL